jgi:hypothetical protein
LTVGWLISEILRALAKEADFNRRTQIIGFKNTNTKASECYDYLFTQLESNLEFIKDGDSLSIISKFFPMRYNDFIGPPEKSMVGSIASMNSNFSPVQSEKH